MTQQNNLQMVLSSEMRSNLQSRPLPLAALFAAARVGLAESKPAGTKNERSAGLVESITATSPSSMAIWGPTLLNRGSQARQDLSPQAAQVVVTLNGPFVLPMCLRFRPFLLALYSAAQDFQVRRRSRVAYKGQTSVATPAHSMINVRICSRR